MDSPLGRLIAGGGTAHFMAEISAEYQDPPFVKSQLKSGNVPRSRRYLLVSALVVITKDTSSTVVELRGDLTGARFNVINAASQRRNLAFGRTGDAARVGWSPVALLFVSWRLRR